MYNLIQVNPLHVFEFWQLIFIPNRQQEKLSKAMNVAGYKEKVPEKIQKANAEKLDSLEKEKLSLEEASQHMEAQISSEQWTRVTFNFVQWPHLHAETPSRREKETP